MNKKWNYEKIKLFIEIESKSNCKLINNNCEGLKDDIDLECKCGKPFSTKFKYFINGKRHCDECGYKQSIIDRMLDFSEIEIYVKENSNCKLKTKEYIKSLQLLEFECECGNIFFRTFPSFKISFKMCDECTLKNKKNKMNTSFEKTKIFFAEYNLKIITPIEEYKNLQQKLSLIDNEGYKYYTKYATVKQNGTACKFSKKNIYSIENINLWISKNMKTFTLLSKEFVSAITKMKWKCKVCDYEWKANWANISTGCSCPECSESKGEIAIRNYLKINNINYIPQKEFDGLVGLKNGKLSYDFYLPEYNLLIEYQGEYHDGNGKTYLQQNLEKQQEHDNRKKEYAKKCNIKLLEIWYWDFDNIEEILNNELLILDKRKSLA